MIPATTPASHAVRWRVSHHNEVVTSLARPASPVPYCLVTETAVLRTISPVDVVDAAVGAMLKDSTRSRLDDAQVEYRRADLTVRIGARHGATWIDVSSRGVDAGQRLATQLCQRGLTVDVA